MRIADLHVELPLTSPRIRRVKCDEGRPACRRCVSTGRVCDGYGIWGGGGTPYGPPQPNRALSVYCTPVPSGNLSDEEHVCLDWLIRQTAKKFSGFFPSEFWSTLIFQASAQEPAVRHAVIALASAHRFEQPWGLRASDASKSFSNEHFTLRHYNKAIQHLCANTTQTNYSLRVVLITCMLFITLEYLRGEYQMGSAHLRYGLRLLTDISTSTSPSKATPKLLRPEKDFAYNALVDTYARLSTQSAMFGHIPASMCLVTQDLQSTPPYIFTSLLEARRSLDNHLNRIRCLERHFQSNHPPNQEMISTQNRILADLALWRKAYTATLARLETDKTSGRNKFGYLLLRVYHEMATIMASVCLPKSEHETEIIFDSYTENFIVIMSGFLDMCKSWTSASFRERDVSTLATQPSDTRDIFISKTLSDLDAILDTHFLNIFEKHTDMNRLVEEPDCTGNDFTVEMGYIPPAYYTALKCRVPRIRRQAIRALRAAPHREGVWNGPLLADVLEEVIGIEEGDLYAGDSALYHSVEGFPKSRDFLMPNVSAEARISDVKVILPHNATSEVSMSYRKRGLDGEWATYQRKVTGCRAR